MSAPVIVPRQDIATSGHKLYKANNIIKNWFQYCPPRLGLVSKNKLIWQQKDQQQKGWTIEHNVVQNAPFLVYWLASHHQPILIKARQHKITNSVGSNETNRFIRSDPETCLKIFQSLVCFPPPSGTYLLRKMCVFFFFHTLLDTQIHFFVLRVFFLFLFAITPAPIYDTQQKRQHATSTRSGRFFSLCSTKTSAEIYIYSTLTALFVRLLDNFLSRHRYRHHYLPARLPATSKSFVCVWHRRTIMLNS